MPNCDSSESRYKLINLLYFGKEAWFVPSVPSANLPYHRAICVSVFTTRCVTFMYCGDSVSHCAVNMTWTKHPASTCPEMAVFFFFFPRRHATYRIAPILRRASKFDLYPISGGELLMRFLWTFPSNFIRILWMRFRRAVGALLA